MWEFSGSDSLYSHLLLICYMKPTKKAMSVGGWQIEITIYVG